MTKAGVAIGEAVPRMQTATKGSLVMSGRQWSLTADTTKKTFQGLAPVVRKGNGHREPVLTVLREAEHLASFKTS